MIKAHKFLEDAKNALDNRATQRDSPQGERAMKRAVLMFNAIRGRDLTESEGWEFMICLKMSRAIQGNFNEDDYTDMAGYAGLLGECESVARTNTQPQKTSYALEV